MLTEDKSQDDGGADDDKSATPEPGHKEDKHTPTGTGSKSKKGDKLTADKKDKKDRKSSAKGRPGRRSSNQNVSPPPGATTPASETDAR